MTLFTWFLLIAVLVLLASCIQLNTRAIVAQRQQDNLSRAITAERRATASLIRLANEEMGTTSSEVPFLDRCCDFTRRTLRLVGVAAFLRTDNGFEGAAVCGIFPPLGDMPETLREQLLANPRHHKQHIRKSVLPNDDPDLQAVYQTLVPRLYVDRFPGWLPPEGMHGIGALVLVPIVARRKVLGLFAAIQDNDSPPLTEANVEYLVRLGEISGMCLEGMRITMDRLEQEHKLRQAHEEGMLQVTTGMVHNIGNAVTVAQLLTSRLMTAMAEDQAQIMDFLTDEVLPELQRHAEAGDLPAFLAAEGQEYRLALEQLLPLMREHHRENRGQVQALDLKLQHITEIIDLQQRFVSELGTEEHLLLDQPIGNAVTLVREAADQQKVRIDCEFGETHRVLADRSMMTQVFLNLLTNALEALAGREGERRVLIRTYMEQRGETLFAVAALSDNGPGLPPEQCERIFDSGYSTKRGDGTGGKGLGLHFCQQTVRKYEGTISVDSKPGQGCTFYICMRV